MSDGKKGTYTYNIWVGVTSPTGTADNGDFTRTLKPVQKLEIVIDMFCWDFGAARHGTTNRQNIDFRDNRILV